MKKINSLASNKQSGASAIEYAIIASVIALAIFAAVTEFELQDAFRTFMESVTDAISIGSSED